MDRLEHDLRRVLDSECWALPYDGALITRARSGAAQRQWARRAGTLAALATITAVVVTATVLDPAADGPVGPANGPTAGPGLIPWIDTPPPPPIRVGRWHLDAFPSELSGRFDGIQASIEDVGPAGPGTVLDYVVVLRNVGDWPIAFAPCPGYAQELAVSDGGGGATAAYQLNCAPKPTLGPEQAARFAMRLDIPTDAQPATEAPLTWRLLESAVEAQTTVTVGLCRRMAEGRLRCRGAASAPAR